MYCGDETGSFIGEVAYSSSRFGYGGEDSPKCVLPSFTHHDGTIPTSTHRCPPQHLDHDVIPIFKPLPRRDVDPDAFVEESQGVIENYDAWENVWHKAFQQLHVPSFNKHTKGGIMVRTQRIHSSGLVSSKVGDKSEDNQEREIMHPILVIDSGNTHPGGAASVGQQYHNSMVQKQKGKMIEILYESLCAPATFIAPSPMLASFANGRQTSLVVDIGAGGTRVTPIVDGLVLQQAQRRNGRGGEWLSNVQERVVEDMIGKVESEADGNASTIHPRYACQRDHSKGSITVKYPHDKVKNSIFHGMAVSSVMYEMKTSPHVTGVDLYRHDDYTIPFIEDEDEEKSKNSKESENGDAMDVDEKNEENDEDKMSSNSDNDDYDTRSKKYYELPDGTRVEFQKSKNGKDLCRLPELLFASDVPYVKESSESSTSSGWHPTLSSLPLHELVKESLSAVADADVRKELCGNIILTGASSLYSNLEQRLSLEAQYLVPNIYKCKVIATRNTVERRFAPWIGGSVLSSLGSFQQLWLSKQEYAEFGMALATQRFP